MRIDFESLIERFTKNLTPTKVILGIAILVIAIAVLNFLVGIAQMLLPIAILGVAGYFGYQWLSSRSEEVKAKKAASAESDEAAADIADTAAKIEAGQSDIDNVAAAAHSLSVEAKDASDEDDNVLLGAVLSKTDGMKIPQRINQKTGLPEADISRLEEAEKQSAEITDSVMAQLAERRKRLLGNEDS